MFPLSRRRTLVAGAALAVVSTVAITSNAAAAPSTQFAFGSAAYGSTAKLGTLVQSDATSALSMCTTKQATRGNNAAATGLGAAGKIGAVTTSTQGSNKSGTAQTVTTTKTGAINLLGGLISADAITSQAIVKHTSSGYQTIGTTKVADLKIAGVKIAVSPKPNSKITLPAGLGEVILNRQKTYNSMGKYQLIVDALMINLNKSSLLGLPTGRIVVGHSNSLLHSPVHTRPYGNAFGTKVSLVGGVVKSGATAALTLPCAGTTSHTLKNNTAAVSVPGVVKVGAVGTTGVTADSSSATSAKTTATTGAVSLFDGAVKLDAIKASASAVQKPGSKISLSSSGTKVLGLTINGKPVTVSAKENTKINVAGLGTLWLNKTTRSSTGIAVYGLQLELLKATNGLKAGAVVSVGYARAGVSPS